LFHLVVRQRRARTINQINKPDHRQNVTEAPFVSTIFRFIDGTSVGPTTYAPYGRNH